MTDESPTHQEVEFTIRLKLQLPTNKDGEIIDEEDYCEALHGELIRTFMDRLIVTGNSADAVDILECREEAALYHPTQEQEYNRVQSGMTELRSRLDDLKQTLDM